MMILNSFICSLGMSTTRGSKRLRLVMTSPSSETTMPAPVSSWRLSSFSQVYFTATSDGVTRS
jgi:hypothetical protein